MVIPRCSVSINSVSILLRVLYKMWMPSHENGGIIHYRERLLIVAQNATAARIWSPAITANAP